MSVQGFFQKNFILLFIAFILELFKTSYFLKNICVYLQGSFAENLAFLLEALKKGKKTHFKGFISLNDIKYQLNISKFL